MDEVVKEVKEVKTKIKCTKCNQKFGISSDRRNRLIEKLGPNYHEVYVCRNCRKELGLDRGGNEKKVSVQGLTCSKCGEHKGATSDRIAKLIAIHGSMELIKENYLCRNCRPKKVKEPKPPKAIKQ